MTHSLASHLHLLGPHLVRVAVDTSPYLGTLVVVEHAVREVEAEALALERDTVVVSVPPLLGREAVVALPDLHLGARGRVAAGVEAEVCAGNLNLGGSLLEDPPLLVGRLAVVAVS